MPKTLKIEPKKVPNVPSETLEKKRLLPAFVITVLSRPVAFSSTHGHHSNAKTPPNFVAQTRQNRAQKLPNVPSESLEKQYSFGQGFIVFDPMIYTTRPVAFSSTHGHHSKR